MRISVVVLVSRPEYVSLVQENLLKLDLGGHDCELVTMIDNNQIGSNFVTEEIKARFTDTKIRHSSHVKPPAGNTPNARDRIAQVRNESRELVGDTEFVFSFEDDCVIPGDALLKFLEAYEMDETDDRHTPQPSAYAPHPELISGVQVGRHSMKIIGAWKANNYQFPTEFVSLGKNEGENHWTEVDGTGMFCYLTYTSLYKEATYGWHEPVGPDVWYGLGLRMKGYRVYVDQRVVVGHRIPNGKTLTPDNVDVVKARFYLHNGRWEHELLSQKA